MGGVPESRLTQLHEGTPGLAWWRDRAVRRKPTSGASTTATHDKNAHRVASFTGWGRPTGPSGTELAPI